MKNREHFVQVKQLILDNQYNIFAVTESWLNSNVTNSEFQIEGYNLIRLDRLKKVGGGVCAYVHSSLKAQRVKELTATSHTGFQQLWFKVQNRKLKSLLVCVAYKPPSCSTICFEDDFMPNYTRALSQNMDIVVCGDLNCNMMNKECAEAQVLNKLCLTMNLTQLITEPTRVTASSQSLIDVILVSNIRIVKNSAVVKSTISDHYIITVQFNLKTPKIVPTINTVRSYRNYKATEFAKDISAVPWDTVEILDDVSDRVDTFNDLFLSILDENAPIKNIKIRAKPSPFITEEIRSLMKERDLSHKIARDTLQPRDWLEFKRLKNKVKNELRNAEKQYVQEQILLNRNEPRSIWKIIRRCIPSKITGKPCYIKPTSVLCEEFNNYFISIGENIAKSAKKLADDYNLSMDLLVYTEPVSARDFPMPQFMFQPVSCEKVKQVLMSMPSNKAPGYDRISINVLKDCYVHILPTITGLINASFSQEVFPRSWKKAEIIPQPKEGDHEIAGNNRPISLLPVLSKVIERVALEQFTMYLNDTGNLTIHQSGNRKCFSTETLQLFITDHIYQAIDNKMVTAVILLDLSKAFDSISHTILLEKLKNLGTSPSATAWFASYLCERLQSVRIGQHLSEPQIVTHGVPQGSILGPLLFNIYINEINRICKDCNIESYVDDSKLLLSFSMRDISIGIDKLNADLRRVTAWCCSNSLLINPGKTKFLVFGTKAALARITIPPVSFLGKELIPVSFAKDLGVRLDCCLSFTDHVENLTSNLMRSLCQINRVKHLFDKKTLLSIINSLVFSKLFYCSTVWAGTFQGNIKKLQLVQNFAARIVSGKRKFDHISSTIKDLGWLTVKNMLLYRDAQMAYKIMNGSVPSYLSGLLTRRSSIHCLNTRNRQDLNIPKCRTSLAQRSFRYRAAKLWNTIPSKVKHSPTLNSFKRSIKNWLLMDNDSIV